MIRKTVLPLLLAAALVATGAPPVSAAPTLPTSIAALGDSITQAMDSCAKYDDCPQNSWSAGTNSSVRSHATRLRTAGATSLRTYNDSVSRSESDALLRQAQRAVAQKAQYVTVEIGANDACAPSVASMTPVATYEANIRAGLSTLRKGLPNGRIFIASIPNLKTLWSINKGNRLARVAWASADLCQSLLADPLATSSAAEARRNTVQARVVSYNAVLKKVCATTPRCTYDGGAVYNYRFVPSQISKRDYFHPSVSGQAKLAAITWPKSPYYAA